jgi:DNA invertase Pin-like site-specific DNA recombinase
MFVRAYIPLQNAGDSIANARGSLDAFAMDLGLLIAARYVEREAVTCVQRVELFRLLSDCRAGDVLMIGEISNLSGFTQVIWTKLREEVNAKRLRIVARDIPTSWTLATPYNLFSQEAFKTVINAMLDVVATIALPTADERQSTHLDRDIDPEPNKIYRGRPENKARNAMISELLKQGTTWRQIMVDTGCSRTLLANITRSNRQQP